MDRGTAAAPGKRACPTITAPQGVNGAAPPGNKKAIHLRIACVYSLHNIICTRDMCDIRDIRNTKLFFILQESVARLFHTVFRFLAAYNLGDFLP